MGTMAERYFNMARSYANATPYQSGNSDSQMRVEINLDAIRKHIADLNKMLVSDKDTQARFRNIIRKELRATRNKVAKAVHGALDNDPRQAYRAIRHNVYKQILGGNINILNQRKASKIVPYAPIRTLQPKQWGGNRRERSTRTEKLNSYYGVSRGFVLRFQNSGTDVRRISKVGPRAIKGGNRGSIRTRGIFAWPTQILMRDLEVAIGDALRQEFQLAWEEIQQ